MPPRVAYMAILFGVSKGIALVLVMGALGLQFVDQIVIAATSATIGAAGIIVAAIIARNATRDNRKGIDRVEAHQEDIKRALGVDRRKEDSK